MSADTNYFAMIARADMLPDAAILPDPAAALLVGISVWTLRRNNPEPAVQITPCRRGRRLGDMRALPRKPGPATHASAGPSATP
jgi:hypothetical protein